MPNDPWTGLASRLEGAVRRLPISTSSAIVSLLSRLRSGSPARVTADTCPTIATHATDLLASTGGLRCLAVRRAGRRAEPSQDSEIFWPMIASVAGAVLVETGVEHPVLGILDAPMSAHRISELCGTERGRRR